MELMIVMIIIGLIIGGIYEARNLSDINKRNSVITALQKHSDAYHKFKEKFGYAPGDYPDRVLAGSDSEKCLFGGTRPIDGDSIIDSPQFEGLCAWRQLGQAGFIDGEYLADEITDAPVGPYANTNYMFDRYMIENADGRFYGNSDAVTLGRVWSGTSARGGFITPEIALSIDAKIDDNNPMLCNLFSDNSAELAVGTGTCLNIDMLDAQFYLTATYNLDSQAQDCYIIYLMDTPYLGS